MAFGSPGVDFNYFLARKYALLQQDSNSQSEQARAATTNAGANVTSATAAANLNNVRANLAPGESAAEIALRRAQTALTTEQSRVVGPESAARIAGITADIGLTQANTGLVGEQTVGARQLNRVYNPNGAFPRLGSLFGGASSLPSLSGPTPRRLPGESEAAYLDRVNGL